MPPEDLRCARDLLDRHIGSLKELDVLALVQSDPDVAWTAAAAASQLGLDVEVTEAALQSLWVQRLLALEPGEGRCFRFGPATDELRTVCAVIATLHRDDRVQLLHLMTASAMDRIRHLASRAFAEAFRVRKRPPEGDDDE